ncbi:MAG: OmpA family protein [Geminicoccaceae bacterium]
MRIRTRNLRRRFLCLLALPLGLLIWSAQPASAFDIAIGNDQSHTYRLGIGVSSLIKIKLLPSMDIDLRPLMTDGDEASLEALENGSASFALVAVDQRQVISGGGLEAIANLGTAGSLTTMLLARSEVDNTAVARILETIFENVEFLTAIDPELKTLDPDKAVMGLTLPLHGGAKQFHAARWASADDTPITREDGTASAAISTNEAAADARNYVLYFGFDDATLNPEAQATLERAAGFAAALEAPAIIVAAYTDSIGDAEYNYLLAERRAAAVMQGLNALNVRYSRIDLSLFGERSPWTVTLDDANEASNRRVELFIEAPVPEVQALPIAASIIEKSGADSVSISPAGGPALPIPVELNDESEFKKPLPARPLM